MLHAEPETAQSFTGPANRKLITSDDTTEVYSLNGLVSKRSGIGSIDVESDSELVMCS